MLIIKILSVVVVLYIIITLYFLIQSYNIQKDTDSLKNAHNVMPNTFLKEQELHKDIISQIKMPKEHFGLMQCLKTLDFIQAMENFYDCEHKPCKEDVENNLREMQKIKCKMKRRIIKLLRGKRKLV